MNSATKLRKSEIPTALLAAFPSYTGRKFSLEVAERVTLHDLNWDGGTCNKYALVSLDGLGLAQLPSESPWNPRVEGKAFTIPQGWVVVQHSHFLGQDCGLRFYVSPADAPKLLSKGSA